MPHPDDADFDAIAAELYGVAPGEFTAARNARVAASDPSLATRLKALRKPTVAAWAVNLLAREGLLADAIELSAALREAQHDLDARELSKLGRERRSLVAALAAQAVDLARARGATVSGATRDDVEKTINAAVMDAAAAAAVMTGRLVKPLEAGSFESADLADAVAGSLPGVDEPAPRDDLAERRARKAAERAVREAERLAHEAERELTHIDARRDRVRERVAHVRERIEDLRRDLAGLEGESTALETELTALDAERTAAAARARSTARDADRARGAVDER